MQCIAFEYGIIEVQVGFVLHYSFSSLLLLNLLSFRVPLKRSTRALELCATQRRSCLQ